MKGTGDLGLYNLSWQLPVLKEQGFLVHWDHSCSLPSPKFTAICPTAVYPRCNTTCAAATSRFVS
jgi:hypothetical protein